MELLDFLRQEGVSESILSEVEHFRSFYRLKEEMERRIPTPQYSYYGKEKCWRLQSLYKARMCSRYRV